MTQQKSEDREVPEGRRKPVPTEHGAHGESPQDDGPSPLSREQGVEGEPFRGGKAVPVKEADRQLRLPFATAENLRFDRRATGPKDVDLSTSGRREAPKAEVKQRQVGPTRLEELWASSLAPAQLELFRDAARS